MSCFSLVQHTPPNWLTTTVSGVPPPRKCLSARRHPLNPAIHFGLWYLIPGLWYLTPALLDLRPESILLVGRLSMPLTPCLTILSRLR